MQSRGLLELHGFRSVSEASKQTGRRLAGCRHPIRLHELGGQTPAEFCDQPHQHACRYIAGRNITGFQGLPDVPFPEQYTRPLLDEAVRVGLRPF